MKESKYDIQHPSYGCDLMSDDELRKAVEGLIEDGKSATGSQFGPSVRMQRDEVIHYAIHERGLKIKEIEEEKSKIEETNFNHNGKYTGCMYSVYGVMPPEHREDENKAINLMDVSLIGKTITGVEECSDGCQFILTFGDQSQLLITSEYYGEINFRHNDKEDWIPVYFEDKGK